MLTPRRGGRSELECAAGSTEVCIEARRPAPAGKLHQMFASWLSPLLLVFTFDRCSGEAVVPLPTLETRWYNQTLDHFRFAAEPPPLLNRRRFAQRYLFSDEYWTGQQGKALPNGCKGPILFYTGNEDSITQFSGAANGFMTTVLAPKWGALIVFAEARYYGSSLPFSSSSSSSFTPKEHAAYLTTEQILADYAELIQRREPSAAPSWLSAVATVQS